MHVRTILRQRAIRTVKAYPANSVKDSDGGHSRCESGARKRLWPSLVAAPVLLSSDPGQEVVSFVPWLCLSGRRRRLLVCVRATGESWEHPQIEF